MKSVSLTRNRASNCDRQWESLDTRAVGFPAFGEMDEAGKSNIADFAAHVTPRCSFEFMPVEGRVYFMRNTDGGP